MVPTNVEVGHTTPFHSRALPLLVLLSEQKKATLRRVEMELDEAAEMVGSSVFFRTYRCLHPFHETTADFANGD